MPELIFFTNITNYICGEKNVMWRNFSFLYRIWTIYGVLLKFMSFLFQIYVEKNLCGENLCGEKITNMRGVQCIIALYACCPLIYTWILPYLKIWHNRIPLLQIASNIMFETLASGDTNVSTRVDQVKSSALKRKKIPSKIELAPPHKLLTLLFPAYTAFLDVKGLKKYGEAREIY